MENISRHEFLNALIGWLGTDKIYVESFKISQENLESLSDEEFQSKFEEVFFNMSISELNILSTKYNLGYQII